VTQLRADAQRNLGLVLDAAAEVFSERGPDASIDEIARRAGVGHATVFRRFPTKDALIVAVVQARIDEIAGFAREALVSDDVGVAFDDFVWRAAELHARERGLFDCLDRCRETPEAEELEALVAELTERAQAAGAIRADVDPGDVSGLVGAALKSAPSDRWRVYVGVVLDGLRPAR
jgi:AcrR family transcriptional regulator